LRKDVQIPGSGGAEKALKFNSRHGYVWFAQAATFCVVKDAIDVEIRVHMFGKSEQNKKKGTK
jgi:hypothetical protein